jgi:hypothetical protein
MRFSSAPLLLPFFLTVLSSCHLFVLADSVCYSNIVMFASGCAGPSSMLQPTSNCGDQNQTNSQVCDGAYCLSIYGYAQDPTAPVRFIDCQFAYRSLNTYRELLFAGSAYTSLSQGINFWLKIKIMYLGLAQRWTF